MVNLPPSFQGATAYPLPSMGTAPRPTGGAVPPPSVGQPGPHLQIGPQEEEWLRRILTPAPDGVTAQIGDEMTFGKHATPEEYGQRLAGWRSIFDALAQNPEAQQALLTAAVHILQPIDPRSGETALNRMLQGALAGTQSYTGAKEAAAEREERAEDRELRRRALETDIRAQEHSISQTESQQAALARLSDSVLESKTFTDEQKMQITSLLDAGETASAMKLMTGKEDIVNVLSDEEVRAQFPSLPSGSIIAMKSNGLPVIVHTPDTDNPSTLQEKINLTTQLLIQDWKQKKLERDPAEALQIATAFHTNTYGIDFAEDGSANRFNLLDEVSEPGSGVTFIPSGLDMEGEEGGETSVSPFEALAGEITERGTGIPSFVTMIKGSIPFFGTTPSERETIKARSRLSQFSRAVVRSRMLNPRAILGEQEMILKETRLGPELLDNPDAMRARMEALDETLDIDIRLAKQDLKEGIYDGEERSNLRASVRGMEAAREFMAIDQRDKTLQGLKTPAAVDKLSDDQVAFLRFAVHDEDWEKLSTPVLQRLNARMSALGVQ